MGNKVAAAQTAVEAIDSDAGRKRVSMLKDIVQHDWSSIVVTIANTTKGGRLLCRNIQVWSNNKFVLRDRNGIPVHPTDQIINQQQEMFFGVHKGSGGAVWFDFELYGEIKGCVIIMAAYTVGINSGLAVRGLYLPGVTQASVGGQSGTKAQLKHQLDDTGFWASTQKHCETTWNIDGKSYRLTGDAAITDMDVTTVANTNGKKKKLENTEGIMHFLLSEVTTA